jgi:uncharacterized protein YcfL
MARIIVASLLALLLLVALIGCEPKMAPVMESSGGRQIELLPVWEFQRCSTCSYTRVYEFVDAERGEHCYVAYWYNGVGLSCNPLEGK